MSKYVLLHKDTGLYYNPTFGQKTRKFSSLHKAPKIYYDTFKWDVIKELGITIEIYEGNSLFNKLKGVYPEFVRKSYKNEWNLIQMHTDASQWERIYV